MNLITPPSMLTLPICGACGKHFNGLSARTEYHAAGTYAIYAVRAFDPAHCPHCGAEFVRLDIDTEAHTCVALSKNEVEKMKITRTKYVIVTADRPTKFLTDRGELSERFEDAQSFDDMDDVSRRFDQLDEPRKFSYLPVTISVEV